MRNANCHCLYCFRESLQLKWRISLLAGLFLYSLNVWICGCAGTNGQDVCVATSGVDEGVLGSMLVYLSWDLQLESLGCSFIPPPPPASPRSFSFAPPPFFFLTLSLQLHASYVPTIVINIGCDTLSLRMTKKLEILKFETNHVQIIWVACLLWYIMNICTIWQWLCNGSHAPCLAN